MGHALCLHDIGGLHRAQQHFLYLLDCPLLTQRLGQPGGVQPHALQAIIHLLQALPRENLVGRKATVLGAYVLGAPGDAPLVTPVEITIGPKP